VPVDNYTVPTFNETIGGSFLNRGRRLHRRFFIARQGRTTDETQYGTYLIKRHGRIKGRQAHHWRLCIRFIADVTPTFRNGCHIAEIFWISAAKADQFPAPAFTGDSHPLHRVGRQEINRCQYQHQNFTVLHLYEQRLTVFYRFLILQEFSLQNILLSRIMFIHPSQIYLRL